MSKVIIIAGSGRSGTTWIQDAIADSNNMKTLFEPLHPIGVPWSSAFSYRHIGSEGMPGLKEFMDKAFAGKMNSLWANYRIRSDRFSLLKYRLPNVIYNFRKFLEHYRKYRPQQASRDGLVVKFIRANLMLKWISENYDHPVLLVIRHPAAVVASRLSIGTADWAADTALDHYITDEHVVRLIKHEFNFDLAQPMSSVSKMACVWCVENVLPLRWAEENGFSVVAYERLLDNPAGEWSRISKAMGLTQLPGDATLAEPSQQAASKMQGATFGKAHLGKWRTSLDQQQLDDIQKILDAFGSKTYSLDEDLPVALERLPLTSNK